VELGLSEEMSRDLVLQTGKGATLLAEKETEEGVTPADLTRKVATPNGTTEAAFKVFLAKDFGPMVSEAMQRAAQRSRELSGG
jgi:pyrroline-5-carboxylate reductase